MASSSNVQINLNDYVSSLRASEGKTPFSSAKLGTLLRKSPTWLRPRFPEESLEKLDEVAASDPWFPSLTKRQRFTGFVLCFFFGVFLFVLASFYVPVLVLRSRKFALLSTLGSCFILLSFGFLRGPYRHLRGLVDSDQLPFTSFYLLSIIATLYSAIWIINWWFYTPIENPGRPRCSSRTGDLPRVSDWSIQSTSLTMMFWIVQLIGLVWYTVANIPGGKSGLWFFKNVAMTLAKKGANTVMSA